MADRLTNIGVSPSLLMALLAILCPGPAHPALPPAAEGAAARTADSAAQPAAAPPGEPAANRESTWAMPPVRFGGMLTYQLRSDLSEEHKSMQKGLTATLNADTRTFIWQPWFARLNGSLALTMSRDNSDQNDNFLISSNSSKSIIMTGNAQLSVLPQSAYPFELHVERNDSRVSTELAVADGYAHQRYGFTQHYIRPEGDSMMGWDSNTQTSAGNRRDRQDTLQLNLVHNLEAHRYQLTGNGSWNTHEHSGEQASQNNLTLQHSYAADSSLSVESMANVSRSGYHLLHGDNDTRLVQLSTLAFWRPAEQAITVTGGARVFALGADSAEPGAAGATGGSRNRNINANVGVNYDLTRAARINAGAGVNLADINGVAGTTTNQFAGASYQPESVEFGSLQYNWSGSAMATNRTGTQDAGGQLTLQLSHSLGRSFKFDGGSTVRVNGSQSVAAAGNSNAPGGEPSVTRQVTHGGSLSWSLAGESGAATVQLSASDSRSFGNRQEFFQMVNFQASSNLVTGGYSSLTGNLTVQAVRQSASSMAGVIDPLVQEPNGPAGKGYVSNSSGSISYQNQRLFGVRRLRLVSDLRLNSQALLPLLGSVRDQETAAWENRLDYVIGRTTFRVTTLIARSRGPKNSADVSMTGETVRKTNKSIMFSISRGFGDF